MSLSYDNNRNLTDDGVYHFVYDAWNRLRKAQRVAAGDTTTFGTYSFYADTRRAGKVVEHCGPEAVANDGGDQAVTFYYGGVPGAAGGVSRWNIFETRNGSNQATRQWVWGTRYVDEVLFMDVNGDPAAGNLCDPDDPNAPAGTKRYHYHQDRNWNVIALTEGAGGVDGRIAERYSYTPYGEFVVLKGDGGSGTAANVGQTSVVGNPLACQGLPFDPELGSSCNRYRIGLVGIQGFAQRDPLGHIDEPHAAYLQLAANPFVYSDPDGRVPIWQIIVEIIGHLYCCTPLTAPMDPECTPWRCAPITEPATYYEACVDSLGRSGTRECWVWIALCERECRTRTYVAYMKSSAPECASVTCPPPRVQYGPRTHEGPVETRQNNCGPCIATEQPQRA
ncbi:MAG: hypothetical protein AB1716_10125 [Planctomycetota bacterium]